MADMAGQWATEIRQLSRMAQTQPQAAYTVFTKCLAGKWLYHLRCTDCDPSCVQRVDDAIAAYLIPALIGREVPGGTPLRELLALPARFGGFGNTGIGKRLSLRVSGFAKSDQALGGIWRFCLPPPVSHRRRPPSPISHQRRPPSPIRSPTQTSVSDQSPTQTSGGGPSSDRVSGCSRRGPIYGPQSPEGEGGLL